MRLREEAGTVRHMREEAGTMRHMREEAGIRQSCRRVTRAEKNAVRSDAS